MTNDELFIKFLKHYTPNFSKHGYHGNFYLFCENRLCDNCKISISCVNEGRIPIIKKPIVLEYLKVYPENGI